MPYRLWMTFFGKPKSAKSACGARPSRPFGVPVFFMVVKVAELRSYGIESNSRAIIVKSSLKSTGYLFPSIFPNYHHNEAPGWRLR